MQRLHRPPLLDPMNRQIIQQFWMARRFGAHPKITGSLDQRRSEMPHPNSVDHDPRGEWVFWGGHRPGKLQPTASLGEGLSIRSGDNGQLLQRHLRPVIAGIAPLKNNRLRDAGVVHQGHSPQGRPGMHGIEFVELALEGPALLGHRRVKEPIDTAQRPLDGRIARIQYLPQFLGRRVGQ